MLGFETEGEVKPEAPVGLQVIKRPPRGLRSERRLLPVVDGPLAGTSQPQKWLCNRFTTRCGTIYMSRFNWDAEGRMRHYGTMK